MGKLVKLFEPIKIGNMELKNRIVMGPLGHGMTYATKPEGYVTDQFIAFYEARARGGVSFIQLTVAGLGRPFATGLVFSPGILSLIDDDHIESARRFTDAMHAYGTKVSFQLTHHGSAIARAVQHRPPVEFPELMRVVTSTGRKDPVTGFETYSMTKDEIKGLVASFAQAAKRGQAAGFDAVRIQGCHSYLIQQFLSPRINQRTDEYGGSVENRARLACEIIRGVRQAVGPDFPILIRMNGDDHVEGGITLDEGIQHAKLFVEAGADVLDISSGPPEAHQWQFISMFQPSGALVPLAAAIKKAVKVPVMTVGKIDAVLGERILEEGKADLIQMARALMADPDLPDKAREGRLEDIRPCIYCGWCQNSGTQGAYASCSVNIGLGKELEYRLEPAAQRKKVMVIGGGPAGMEAARTLAQRGHQAELYERSTSLGGQWNILTNLLPEEGRLVDYLAAGMKKAGVQVYLNTEVTAKMVLEKKPDAVVVATGSTSATPDIPGGGGKNLVQAVDVLTGKVKTGKEVVVIGGRTVGLDTALFLAERGKRVSVVTRSSFGRGIVHNLRATLYEYLVKYGVYLFDYTLADSITEKGVNCWRTGGETKERDNLFFFLPADTVVLAVGAVNDSRLGDELTGLVPEIFKVGDCAGKRSIFAAIRGGSEAARKI